MKKMLRWFFAACATLTVSVADDPSITGHWQIHNSVSGNESDEACTFTQKEQDLTGDCNTTTGAVKISGKVDGKKIKWTYKSEYNGTPITVTHEGSFDSATKIKGTISVPEFSAEGDFTATLSK